VSESVFDSHIHFGRFGSVYYTAAFVVRTLQHLGVGKWAIMSTSTFDPDFDYRRVEEEFRTILDIALDETYPIMIVRPEMLKSHPDLDRYFTIPYRAIKIHGYTDEWEPYGKPTRRVADIARERGLTLMFHTGGRERSDAGAYPSDSR